MNVRKMLARESTVELGNCAVLEKGVEWGRGFPNLVGLKCSACQDRTPTCLCQEHHSPEKVAFPLFPPPFPDPGASAA